jgi:hypothetical protein
VIGRQGEGTAVWRSAAKGEGAGLNFESLFRVSTRRWKDLSTRDYRTGDTRFLLGRAGEADQGRLIQAILTLEFE